MTMFPSLQTAALLTLLSSPSWAGSETFVTIPKPPSILSGWGHALVPVGDLDGDGVDDLAISRRSHGGHDVGTVHSGADGSLLYVLDVPFEPTFWGAEIIALEDETGDGVQELLVTGDHSGDANSPDGRLRVYSGVDGTLLRDLTTPSGVVLMTHAQGASQTFGDIDGDGVDDVLCLGLEEGPGGGVGRVMLSGSTAAPIWWARGEGAGVIAFNELVRLSDHDGDGRDDFALLVFQGATRTFQVHSSADGALLSVLYPTGMEGITQNGEPIVGVTDLDGDGLRDIAVGGVFFGYLAVYSSMDGSRLRVWDCEQDSSPCLGGAIIEPGDLNGDGHSELLVLEGGLTDTDTQAFLLDPVSSELLDIDDLQGTFAGYVSADGVTARPGAGPLGFPGFVAFESLADSVTLRRFAPMVGSRGCSSVPNSSGGAASLRIYGTVSVAANHLRLELVGGVPGQFGVFAYGSRAVQVPFGRATLCVGGDVGRFAAQPLDADGRFERVVNLAPIVELGLGSWTFQGLFRDPVAGGLQSSDAVTVELVQ